MGAASMTMLVNLNMVSERLSAKASIGRRLGSGTSARAMANRMLKTTTCSTWPSATDLAMFSGKMSMMSCVAVCGVALRDSAVAEGGGGAPSPARVDVVGGKTTWRREGGGDFQKN